MSDKAERKAELARRCGPVIMRIAVACDGVGAGIASYALASMLAVAWRKTGMGKKELVALVEALFDNDVRRDAN